MNRRGQGKSQARERIPTRGADPVRGPTPFPSRERLDGRFSCPLARFARREGGWARCHTNLDLAAAEAIANAQEPRRRRAWESWR
jgi:hypothetical protein